ncbi:MULTISPECIES: hypothetical protein [unclassified Tolypothrix]|uniref:hypothetical protein n=1 Tax=unclassified Tolypothrix TaxID=2649714 RepID=UPI0005EABD5E|nr:MULTISPECIES: hypothetical protein [unclassified Tolypothrix]BAY89455.1 hypothetical protein NIES3275_14580 [Microchaete diplosiphon NIES-3275]EKF01814.1 hypothetical protein FDUTEX481_07419 [Tolypothrix sp. PCC 7601]MBE9083730.1 hypothetical protein [Tolypothrix sp. LEGE 11397]UYD23741.1 hypothetical protein HGR01_19715 [Tolypothrix sp. PCC 7712]UYD34035.1 hypothetical protein HG267_35050 [Tolypothrix sp. PCC 7601]
MEPVTLTAAGIATLVFTKAFETTIEKATESVLKKLEQLRQKILQKFKGTPRVEAALVKVQQGSQEDLNVVAAYLQEAMNNDPQFAEEVKTLATEIHQEINIGKVEGKNVQNVYGGEAFQSNDAKAPTIQGGSGHTINITYNNSPD